jgi:hypothetical protein
MKMPQHLISLYDIMLKGHAKLVSFNGDPMIMVGSYDEGDDSVVVDHISCVHSSYEGDYDHILLTYVVFV